MKIVIISGRSGSGKSTALQSLEDQGYTSIDNMPVALLPELARHLHWENRDSKAAICIDARNAPKALATFPAMINALKDDDIQYEIVFLDAHQETLLQRYSATRRKHPLSDDGISLREAIAREKKLLEPIYNLADLSIDTTHLSLQELRAQITRRVAKKAKQDIALLFHSFGFKHGVPIDADMVFDVRCLPNPYWDPAIRHHTGRDEPVIEFLRKEPEVNRMFSDIHSFLDRWITSFEKNNRNYLTVAIGCTGGQHRSVFLVEQLSKAFSGHSSNIQVRHRELQI